jgi:hypothetical protein
MEKTERRNLQIKYQNKKINAKKENIIFDLSFDDFVELADKANISSANMNIRGFHLSRYNDTGAYKIGNCRFITCEQNYKEKKISDKSRAASRNNVKKQIV